MKGFMCREVKQATLSRYCSGSLEVKKCLCFLEVTLSGYCLDSLVAEQHREMCLKVQYIYYPFPLSK